MKAGDIVVLKSGSPKMTVKKVEDGNVSVIWFEGYGGCQWGTERHSNFPEGTLTLKVTEE